MISIQIPEVHIRNFCSKWEIRQLGLFGSVLRLDFNSDSDVDVLVTFNDKADWSLFDLAEMETELESIFKRKVDLITRKGIERSRNTLRKQEILNSSMVIYDAAA